MLTIREVIKTFYNALLQRLKKHRGNWEQNDPTADDYIKNRPFYTDETNKETVVKTKTFTATSSYWWGSPFAFIPVVGETYKVTFDDKEYICQCKVQWDAKCIGNVAIDWDGPDTGEPFFYYWYNSSEYGLCVRYQGQHTIAIETIKVEKLDKRYLPDLGLATVATSGNYNDLENRPTIYTDVVRYNTSQSLTTAQKTQARTNIGAAATSDLAAVANTGDYNDLSNRPCYLEIEMTPYLGVTNKTVSMSFVNSNVTNVRYGHILSNPATMPVNGTTYHIIYNGTEYNVTSNNPANLLGNKSLYSSSYENTGEPFAVLCDPANLWLYHNGTATSAIISIYTITNKNVKQLSEELIPDTIARVSDFDNLPIHETYAQGLGETYTWDGVVDGLESYFSPSGEFYKVSDYVPIEEEMMGASYIWYYNLNQQVDKRTIDNSTNSDSSIIYDMNILVNEEGLWFRRVSNSSSDYAYVKSLTLNGKVIELSAPLDEKFIPSTIARTEDIVRSDWNETDETSLAFIKNKPDLDALKDYITLRDQVNGFTYYVSMRNGNLVSICAVSSLEIAAMPITVEYMEGEDFNIDGLLINAIREDGTMFEITEYTYDVPSPLTPDVVAVTVSYVDMGKTYTVDVPITVNVFDPAVILVDFDYTDNGDGTYTITDWKGTENGQASTRIVIPDYQQIIL